jgi:5-methylcytosine-specific restriction endonuclease McrA
VTVYHRYADGRWRCKRCIGDAVSRRHRRLKQLLVEQAGGACALCGYDRTPVSLHFHHVDPATKDFPMTMARGVSQARYEAELRKCVLLCANCHGEVEAGLVVSPPAGTRWSGGLDSAAGR